MTRQKLLALASSGALAAGMVVTSAAWAARPSVLVLKANGQILANGAPYAALVSSFAVRATASRNGTTQKIRTGCVGLRIAGTIQRDPASDLWHLVEEEAEAGCGATAPVGEAGLREMPLPENELVLSPARVASDRVGLVLERIEREIAAEREVGEEPKQPLRCTYGPAESSPRSFRADGKPLVLKMRGTLGHRERPPATEVGCGATATWKATFPLTSGGAPIVAALEEPPTVTRISPAEGPQAEGTTVSIFGTKLSGATSVKFGSANAKRFTVNSDSSITAIAPAGSGIVDVTVTTQVSTTATSVADRFAYRPPPTVTEVGPKVGPESGGTEVTITGTSFTPTSTVKFGAAAASRVKVNSASSITATSPNGGGSVHVTVTSAGGTSATGSSDEFTYVPVV